MTEKIKQIDIKIRELQKEIDKLLQQRHKIQSQNNLDPPIVWKNIKIDSWYYRESFIS